MVDPATDSSVIYKLASLAILRREDFDLEGGVGEGEVGGVRTFFIINDDCAGLNVCVEEDCLSIVV